MLQKFLFVGLGGSGGKTLRMLHQHLSDQLADAGYRGGIPGAWQFLHIDVPVTPDGTSPELPPQLPPGSYVGMAPTGLTYRDLDAMLEQKGPRVLEHATGWRPDAQAVAVAPAFGAGQYRAVGRVITGVALPAVVAAIKRSALELEDVAVDRELDEVALALTGSGGVDKVPPQVIVVSSIAGGSGAGAILDVCDAIRQLMPSTKDQIAAVLYTPSVFDDLPPASRAGVNANGLAAMCELLASYWNNEPPSDDEYALLNAGGVDVTHRERRGPSMSFLVGRNNGEIAYNDQLDVYRAMARCLAAWATDEYVQDTAKVSVIGNWGTKAARTVDESGLVDGPQRLAPFSAIGYASVDLGRGRFAKYASERLARKAVEQLLRGHWTDRVPDEVHPDVARDEASHDQLYAFLEASGLRELGPVHNQVIDALRGGTEGQARKAKLAELRQTVLREVTEGGGELDTHDVLQRIEGRVADKWHPTLDTEYEQDKERARTWYVERQRAVTGEVADLLGRTGGPVTARVLELAIAELTTSVVPELNQMAETSRRQVGTMRQRMHSVFASYDGKIRTDNPLIVKGIDEGLDTIHAEAEARLFELSARLIGDLTTNLLEPLRATVTQATARLENEATGTSDRRLAVEEWPIDVPPRSMEPAQNELLLEPISGYPEAFLDRVRRTLGVGSPDGAVLDAVREIIAGRDDDGRQTAVRITIDWVPSQQVLRTMGSSRGARFDIHIEPEALLQRARAWVHRPNTAIGDYITEPLHSYLGDGADAAEQPVRLDRFRAALTAALQIARPLVEIDAQANNHFHGTAKPDYNTVMTRLPFPRNHPAREVVARLFPHRRDVELDRMFDDSSRQRIEITTFLDAPAQPMVFRSLVGPIAGDWAQRRAQQNLGGFWQWRRARPLRAMIPTAPTVRRAMIRGWFVARMLGYAIIDNPRAKPVTVFRDGRHAAFPHPLLGPPVVRPDDVLPAVLESLGIAIVSNAQLELLPYNRLYELGVGSSNPTGSGLASELEEWIAGGAIARGAPPSPLLDGDASERTRAERADAALAFLRRYLEHYQNLSDLEVADRHQTLPRAWELAREVVAELADLQALVAKVREDPDFAGGVG